MAIHIREATTARDRRAFIELPWQIYRGDKNWVPPLIMERKAFLDPRQNPFFEHAEVAHFLAQDDARNDVGRIAAIVNRNHLETHHDNVGFFGLFESIDDQAVADRLFTAAAEFLRSRSMVVMRGPASLSVNDEYGLLVDAFDSPPVFMMPYNPAYYPGLLETHGFVKAMDLYAYRAFNDKGIPERLSRGVEILKKRHNVAIRTIRLKDFDQEVRLIRDIYNQAWEKNWGAVAMTEREFAFAADGLKKIIKPDLCFIAEAAGQPIGFSLALPDYNQVLIHLNGRLFPFGICKWLYYRRKMYRIRVFAMGILPQYRRLAVDAAFIHATFAWTLKYGYRESEQSWILENNAPMNNGMLRLGFERTKTYRVYERRL